MRGEGITRLNALVHLPEFVLDVQESLSLSLSCSNTLKSPHDVVISLDNALSHVTCSQLSQWSAFDTKTWQVHYIKHVY